MILNYLCIVAGTLGREEYGQSTTGRRQVPDCSSVCHVFVTMFAPDVRRHLPLIRMQRKGCQSRTNAILLRKNT